MGQSIEFLQGLLEKDPANKALLDAYVELCKKDADMSNAAEERRVKIMENAATERLNLIKQDFDIYKKIADNTLNFNKAVLDAKNPPPNWAYHLDQVPGPLHKLPLENKAPSAI